MPSKDVVHVQFDLGAKASLHDVGALLGGLDDVTRLSRILLGATKSWPTVRLEYRNPLDVWIQAAGSAAGFVAIGSFLRDYAARRTLRIAEARSVVARGGELSAVVKGRPAEILAHELVGTAGVVPLLEASGRIRKIELNVVDSRRRLAEAV